MEQGGGIMGQDKKKTVLSYQKTISLMLAIYLFFVLYSPIMVK
jgi:hypothetical protein